MSSEYGVSGCCPLAIEKVEPPTTALKFLGILLDTTKLWEYISQWTNTICQWVSKTRDSLLGGSITTCYQSCTPRAYICASHVQHRRPELDYYTHQNKEFHSDLLLWHSFLGSWNRISFLKLAEMPQAPDLMIQTNTSGSCGCLAFCSWSPTLTKMIMAKELVPIVLSCAAWGLNNMQICMFPVRQHKGSCRFQK